LGNGNENVKVFFRAYLCQKWIDLTRMISSQFYTYCLKYISSAEMLASLPHLAAALRPCTSVYQ